MSEPTFQQWRRFDEQRPLDPVPDLLKAIADIAATLCTVNGAQVGRQAFLPWWLQE